VNSTEKEKVRVMPRLLEMTGEELESLPKGEIKPLLADYLQSLTEESDLEELRIAFLVLKEAGVIKRPYYRP
jgi:hypothetical protein